MASHESQVKDAINVVGDDMSKLPAEPAPAVNGNGNDSHTLLDSYEPASLALHADDELNVVADVAPPIHVSTTFRYSSDPEKLIPFHEREGLGLPDLALTEHVYSRHSSHGGSRFEAILSKLLHGHVLTYSSGLASFHALLTCLVPKKIAIGGGYHGSHGVLDLYKRLTGAQILPLDCKAEDLDEGDLIWLETPVNPTGLAFDIQHYADIAHSRGAYLGVDSTFGPPPLQDPFRHGADVVMHSGTKYIAGHSDLLCGVLATKRLEWHQRLTQDRLFLGSVMGGLDNWLGVRSLRTLELRVARQSESAGTLVDALDGGLTGATVGTGLSQSDVEVIRKVLKEVKHASLQTEDRKTWLRKQMPNGFGPVFSLIMKDPEIARKLPSKLHLFHHATSLGGVESLIEWRTMTDSTVSKELLRVSIGVEDVRDLLHDFLQAFRVLIDELKL